MMADLTKGTRISLTNGGCVTIIKELGRGGQGVVYLVDLNGEQKVLKWYLTAPDEKFYRNLEKNIMNGAPSDAFLWPEHLTNRQLGSFGYVMQLRPKNYYEFGNYLLAKVCFKSFTAMLAAAMKICDGFMMLHRCGYSYQDLNDGNFFIDPTNGDVLICDNDNVMPQGEKSGIMGKARYMAPEIVAGGIPDKRSDRFSLSVILFMLFYANHPFEGERVIACPCMTESYERKFYGSEAIFIYDPTNNTNRPVRGIHQNVIKRWFVFPSILRETFEREFSQDYLHNPEKRLNRIGRRSFHGFVINWSSVRSAKKKPLLKPMEPLASVSTEDATLTSPSVCLSITDHCLSQIRPKSLLITIIRQMQLFQKMPMAY